MDFTNVITRDTSAASSEAIRRYQEEFDVLRAEYHGQPVNEIRAAVQKAWIGVDGLALAESDLTVIAEDVSVGAPSRFVESVSR